MEISDDIVVFTDPLYELSVFRISSEGSLFDRVTPGMKEKSSLYRKVLQTVELNRLNYLRQAGFSFLLYPSATHTRFAHSVGTWTLGKYALDHVGIVESFKKGKQHSTIGKLGEWLDSQEYTEEFLLSLLLHDIGHLPFSHVLENNAALKNKNICHEDLTNNYVIKAEKNAGSNERFWAKRKGSTFIADVLNQYSGMVQNEIITSFISGTFSEEKLKLNKYRQLKAAAKLVSGEVDLDRLDHYNRDSYFMGLKLSNVNIRGLLENLVLDINHDPPELCVKEDGIAHILNLLFAKEMLWQKALDHDLIRAYECMLNKAVDIVLNTKQSNDILKKIIFMTDDELVNFLMQDDRAAEYLRRIFSRAPYELMYKEITAFSERQIQKNFSDLLKIEGVSEDDFLLYLSPHFEKEEKSWLYKMRILRRDLKIDQLVDKHDPDLVRYFETQSKNRRDTVRVYARTKKLANSFKEKLKKYLRQ